MKIFSVLFSAVFIFCLILFLFLSQISPLKESVSKSVTRTAETEIYFIPKILSHGCYTKQTADIYINSHNNYIASAQIELSYDPFSFTDFSISPSDENFFGDKKAYQINLSEVRAEYGRASLSLETSEGFLDQSGEGKVATINFTANPVASGSTQIVFLNKTNVMGKNNRQSLLKSTTPLLINCF